MALADRRRSRSPPANRRRSRSPPANRRRSRSPPTTTSSPYFQPDLIPEVARRLTNLEDFFALRATCRTYRAVLPLTSSNLASQEPLLLVPQIGGQSRALFHPSLRRLLRFRLPCDEILRTRFYSFRCLVGIQDDNDLRRGLRIVHLLTGEQAPLPSPPDPFNRVLLAGDLALAWSVDKPTIQYCRLEAADWRVAYTSEPYLFHDLVCVNGTIYALVTSGSGYRLAVLGLSENPVGFAFLGGEFDEHTVGKSAARCLATCRGDLILIMMTCRSEVLALWDCRLYRWQAGEEKWVRITGLGGCTLFLMDDRFIACLGPDHPGVRGDCIYSAFGGFWSEFSLVDGSYSAHGLGWPRVRQTPVWVFPSMC